MTTLALLNTDYTAVFLEFLTSLYDWEMFCGSYAKYFMLMDKYPKPLIFHFISQLLTKRYALEMIYEFLKGMFSASDIFTPF